MTQFRAHSGSAGRTARRSIQRAVPAFARDWPRCDRPLWVPGGSAGREYRDNSSALLGFLVRERPDVDAIWVIDRRSKDVGIVAAIGPWVDHGSLRGTPVQHPAVSESSHPRSRCHAAFTPTVVARTGRDSLDSVRRWASIPPRMLSPMLTTFDVRRKSPGSWRCENNTKICRDRSPWTRAERQPSWRKHCR